MRSRVGMRSPAESGAAEAAWHQVVEGDEAGEGAEEHDDVLGDVVVGPGEEHDEDEEHIPELQGRGWPPSGPAGKGLVRAPEATEVGGGGVRWKVGLEPVQGTGRTPGGMNPADSNGFSGH